jgi:hypothetical protein
MNSWKITYIIENNIFHKAINANNIKDALDYFNAFGNYSFIISIEMVIPNAG